MSYRNSGRTEYRIDRIIIYLWKVNKYGFIETPFVKIKEGKADFDDIEYLGADEEEGMFIAQADTLIDENGNFLTDEVDAVMERK